MDAHRTCVEGVSEGNCVLFSYELCKSFLLVFLGSGIWGYFGEVGP